MALRPPSPNDPSPQRHDHTAHTEERRPEVGPQPVPGIAVDMAGMVQDGSGGCKQTEKWNNGHALGGQRRHATSTTPGPLVWAMGVWGGSALALHSAARLQSLKGRQPI